MEAVPESVSEHPLTPLTVFISELAQSLPPVLFVTGGSVGV